MKVTVIKTFVNENGINVLKGRKIEVDEKTAKELEANGIIESVTEKKKSIKK